MNASILLSAQLKSTRMKPPINRLPELTNRELEIIKVLWRIQKGALREVHNELTKDRDPAYATTKTVLDRMVDKRYATRDKVDGLFVYSPLLSKPLGLARRVQNFLENVLEVDRGALPALFAKSSMLTPQEVDELKQLIEQSNSEESRKK